MELTSGYFFVGFDTSVSTKKEYIPGYGFVGGQRVENIGLLNHRQNGITIGIGVAVVRTILLVACNVRKNNES